VVIAGHEQQGLKVDYAVNVTISDSLVGNIRTRALALADMMVDIESCISICAFHDVATGNSCPDTSMTNTIAAGCPYAGII
jgi:hypothetical protein